MKNYQDTENKILGNLLRTPLESKSLNQIAIDTRLSYVTIHKLAPMLIKKRLIKIEEKGKAHLTSIDFEQACLEKLSSAILYEKSNFLKKYPQLILLSKEIEEALAGKFYTLILFGSYAKEKPKKDSDIDLLFIVPRRNDKYKEKINKALELISGKRHIVIVSIQDFVDMLNEKNTVGRAAFQHGIVLFGAEHYYSMVKKYVREKGY
jgi:predicted nucleotidyltransferase